MARPEVSIDDRLLAIILLETIVPRIMEAITSLQESEDRPPMTSYINLGEMLSNIPSFLRPETPQNIIHENFETLIKLATESLVVPYSAAYFSKLESIEEQYRITTARLGGLWDTLIGIHEEHRRVNGEIVGLAQKAKQRYESGVRKAVEDELVHALRQMAMQGVSSWDRSQFARGLAELMEAHESIVEAGECCTYLEKLRRERLQAMFGIVFGAGVFVSILGGVLAGLILRKIPWWN